MKRSIGIMAFLPHVFVAARFQWTKSGLGKLGQDSRTGAMRFDVSIKFLKVGQSHSA
jgi:hypothetical protein